MPIRYPRRAGMLLKTRQTTCYHVGDDGDYEAGLASSYTVLTAGQHSGTTAVDNPHYAAATISFASATKKILDSANGLVTVLTGDTIRVIGSVSNDGVYTVATGGVAGEIVTVQALTDEAAGAYITICKRATPSNNAVLDNITGLMWLRYTTGGPALKYGEASNGAIIWYDATKCYALHPAAADLQMTATGLKIIGGAAELPRYFVGATLVCSGFANAVNNLPGYRVTSVTVNGADLDIGLWTGRNTLIAEAAAGSRAIKIVCRSIFSLCSMANAASLGGYTDWRVPDDLSLASLRDMEAGTAVPNAVAFPSWPADYVWCDTTRPDLVTHAMYMVYSSGVIYLGAKTGAYFCSLVRGGVNA